MPKGHVTLDVSLKHTVADRAGFKPKLNAKEVSFGDATLSSVITPIIDAVNMHRFEPPKQEHKLQAAVADRDNPARAPPRLRCATISPSSSTL